MSTQQKSELFGLVLKKLRLEKGMTQEKLAEKAGINEKYYGRVERGNSFPTITIIFQICDALDITSYKLMSLVENFYNH